MANRLTWWVTKPELPFWPIVNFQGFFFTSSLTRGDEDPLHTHRE